MTNEPIPPWKTKKWRVPKWVVIVAIIVAAIALLLIAANVYQSSRLRSELAAIRKAGYPVTLEELDAWYVMPEGPNAAVALAPVFAALNGTSGREADLPVVGNGKLPPRGQPLPADQLAACAKYVSENAASLDTLRKAVAIDECRYPVKLTEGAFVLLPHLAKLRAAGRLLQLEALVKAQQGDAAGAAESLRASLRLARTLAKEPLLISQLVRWAILNSSVDSFERCAAMTSFTEPQLAGLAAALKEEEGTVDEGLVRAMVAERCTDSALFDDPAKAFASQGLGPGRVPPTLIALRLSGLMTADHVDCLRRLGSYIEVCRKPYPQRIDAVQSADQMIEQDAAAKRLGPLTRMLLPVLARVQMESALTLARLRAAQVAVAIERYRLAHGKLPATVDDLVPQFLDPLPEDPFDGRSIRARALPKGFVAYSIGKDAVDNQGQPPDPENRYDGPGDVTVTVERGK